jgi:hypothetical protein
MAVFVIDSSGRDFKLPDLMHFDFELLSAAFGTD